MSLIVPTSNKASGSTGGNSFGVGGRFPYTLKNGKTAFLTVKEALNALSESRLRSLEITKTSVATQVSNKAETSTRNTKRSDPDSSLTTPMAAMEVGDAVPVVFARRRAGGTGGVIVRPRATEALFTNTASTITSAYHCILGDGYIYPVQVRDARNGPDRVGSFSQNWNQRAGSWRPGRIVTQQTAYTVPEFPQSTGQGGDYTGVTTIEFRGSFDPRSQLDRWKMHYSVFVRGGLRIDRGRVLDAVVGPSDNLVDLWIWAQLQSGMLAESDIDMDLMQDAARFLDVNQLFCNAEFSESKSLPDAFQDLLPSFLLRESSTAGKFHLRPTVPTTSSGAISTAPIVPDWIFDERSIAPGSYQERWTTRAARRARQLSVLWRQQTSDVELPLNRDLQILAAGVERPQIETYDLRQFATSEAHAAIAGGYRQAMQILGQGTASVRLLAGNQTGKLKAGMIVQIALSIVAEGELPDQLKDFWWIDRIRLDSDGSETLELIHCPVDAEGRSLVALHVVRCRDNAPGFLLPYPTVGEGDLPGREADTTVPAASTSGTPYTRGGGGGTTAFNRTGGGGDPGRNQPPAPPEGGDSEPGGSDIGEAGGPVTDPEDKPKKPEEGKPGDEPSGGGSGSGWGSIQGHPWPSECRFGVHQIRTRIQGVYLGTVVDYLVVTIEEVQYESTGTREETIGGQLYTFVTYEFRVQEPIPNAPRTFVVESQEGPVSYPLVVEVLDWQCRLRDGTAGPIRTPNDPPSPPIIIP